MNEDIIITLIKQLHETNQSLLTAINQTNKHVADINTTMREHFGIHTTQIKQHDEDIQEIKQDINSLDLRVEATEKAIDRIHTKTNMLIKFVYFIWAISGGLLTYFAGSIKQLFTK